MRPLVLVLVQLVAWGAFAQAGSEVTHKGVVKTKRFEIRFRAGSRAAADADRQAVAAERDLDRIAAALETTPKGPYVLWIYDDPWELQQATGTQGNAGFSHGNASHVPFDNDQTRLHELVHIVAYEWPASGSEARNLFLVEGLANAVLEFVHGVHVHAVAAHYQRAGKLPPLSEMTEVPDFYAWLRAHPGFNAYDVAGSWMRFLLDVHGIPKSKRYYTGTPAKSAFGKDIGTLEKAWRAMLEAYPMRPEVETLLTQRDGKEAAFVPFAEGVPPALLGTPQDWVSILGRDLVPEAADRWRREGDALVGTNPADEWTACGLGTERLQDCVVRAKVATTGYTPVQVRFGPANQVMFVAPGTFLFRGEQPVASDPAVNMPLGSTTFELVIARTGRTFRVWVDGRRALETDAGAEGPLPVGVGMHKGSAVFHDVRVRRLP